MFQNSVKAGFVFLLFGMVFWFSFSAGRSYINFSKHSVPVSLEVKGWEIKEGKKDVFQVIGNFSFEYKGKKYEGKGIAGAPYPNRWAAEKNVEKKANVTRYEGWLNPHHPHHVVLEKAFPWKKMIYAGCLLVLLIYFSLLFFILDRPLYIRKDRDGKTS